MNRIEVTTQAELDAALKEHDQGRDAPIVCIGSGSFTVGGSATVGAWGSATVWAWGSATVRAGDSATVEAWHSATVEAWDSATVRAGDYATVEAWDSATVEAWGSATVRAWDYATVRAGQFNAVIKQYGSPQITGGVLIEPKQLTTTQEWIDYYRAEVHGDVAILYKALDADFGSSNDFAYEPGKPAEAPDWDGGKKECGGGLHFCARPFLALGFNAEAEKFLACPVAVAEIVVHPDARVPSKVKAPRTCGPCWEVDEGGEPVSEADRELAASVIGEAS